jgi:hypothetical protein
MSGPIGCFLRYEYWIIERVKTIRYWEVNTHKNGGKQFERGRRLLSYFRNTTSGSPKQAITTLVRADVANVSPTTYSHQEICPWSSTDWDHQDGSDSHRPNHFVLFLGNRWIPSSLPESPRNDCWTLRLDMVSLWILHFKGFMGAAKMGSEPILNALIMARYA